MTPDVTRYTDTIDRKVAAVARGFFDNQSGMSMEDYEDMCQEARMECWVWLTNHPLETLGMGLVRVLTMSSCRDYERMQRRHQSDESLPEWHDQGTAPTQVDDVALTDILGKIVNDEREAAIAIAVVYEELSQREAAVHLGVDRDVVRRTMRTLAERALALGIEA